MNYKIKFAHYITCYVDSDKTIVKARYYIYQFEEVDKISKMQNIQNMKIYQKIMNIIYTQGWYFTDNIVEEMYKND